MDKLSLIIVWLSRVAVFNFNKCGFLCLLSELVSGRLSILETKLVHGHVVELFNVEYWGRLVISDGEGSVVYIGLEIV